MSKVTSYKLQATSHTRLRRGAEVVQRRASPQVTSYMLHTTSNELHTQQATSYKLQATSYTLHVTTYPSRHRPGVAGHTDGSYTPAQGDEHARAGWSFVVYQPQEPHPYAKHGPTQLAKNAPGYCGAQRYSNINAELERLAGHHSTWQYTTRHRPWSSFAQIPTHVEARSARRAAPEEKHSAGQMGQATTAACAVRVPPPECRACQGPPGRRRQRARRCGGQARRCERPAAAAVTARDARHSRAMWRASARELKMRAALAHDA